MIQKYLLAKGLGITFQFTAPYTPQHNRNIERSFATLYGQMRAMMNLNGIEGDFCQTLWDEAANFENNTRNITVNCNDNACPYKKITVQCPLI